MNKRQVKACIKILKTKDMDLRPALQKVLVDDGTMYITNGYVVFEVGDIKDYMLDKCFTLDTLIKWNATNTKATDIIGCEYAEKNDDIVPQIKKLIGSDFEPATNAKFNIDYLKLCCDFLGVKNVKLEVSKSNKNLYQVVPCNPDEMDIITKAMESKAYIMGVK